MIQIHQITNDYQHSRTYILFQEDCEYVWLVDCGDAVPVERWLREHNKELKGVFLTHCHDDHIFGLRILLKDKPTMLVCLSAHEGVKCVQDIRMNLSKYTSAPFQLLTEHFIELSNGETYEIFPNEEIIAIQADGHSPDSMIYQVNNYLFTGDAFIPPLPVVTKLPGADKKRAAESLEMIKTLVAENNLTICAGHSINETQYK